MSNYTVDWEQHWQIKEDFAKEKLFSLFRKNRKCTKQRHIRNIKMENKCNG